MTHPTGPVAERFAQRVRAWERAHLGERAVRSFETAGRRLPEDECTLRTPFQRDRDRIVHSKSFRRLKNKTQVYIAPRGDHFRTRLTHTLEVSGISRGVARALALNEDLAEAIAAGHDLGHAPFGHTGEEALDEALRAHGRRFRHNEQSLRVVEVLERDGRGLNLTAEVREGILRHTGPHPPTTLEGRIVRLVDRFAYVNHDIDDALRAGILLPGDLPDGPISLLGRSSSVRIDALVHDLVETSAVERDIVQSEPYAEALLELRRFMFDRVYLGEAAAAEKGRAIAIVTDLVELYLRRPDLVGLAAPGADPLTRATDWVAGMTDRFCLDTHERLIRAPAAPAA